MSMSDCESSEFDERLVELSNWQIEQQKKLKKFQEAQRKLLDSEHEKILSSLKTQNYEQRHMTTDKDPSMYFSMPAVESYVESQSKLSDPNNPFNFKSDAIKLKDPAINLCRISQFSQNQVSDELFDNNNEDSEGTGVSKAKRFLRRGDGLARFRMTFDDFKSPPDIYKEKKIKTYLNKKPEFSRKTVLNRKIRPVHEMSRKRPSNKTGTVPVNIYVANTKQRKNVSPVRNTCDSKTNRISQCQKNKEIATAKVPLRTLTLKPVPSPDCLRDNIERENFVKMCEKSEVKLQDAVKSPEKPDLEKRLKKDERELRMFEILEGKIDDGSLSPNSSLVARFMEESLCSTPSKLTNGDYEKDIGHPYLESLRNLQRQYLTPEQIDRIQECSEEYFSGATQCDGNTEVDDRSSDSQSDKYDGVNVAEDEKISENSGDGIEEELNAESDNYEKKSCHEEFADRKEITLLSSQGAGPSKTILQRYIDNFKKLKREVRENCQSDVEEIDESMAEGIASEIVSDPAVNQREIALKLQRKALQDNVKNLLNWDGASRRKATRRVVKKTKTKQFKTEKSKNVEKKEEENIVFNSRLLKERLEELEKEIEIFKRENRSLTQLQRECGAEKSKLEKERKEFEKYMGQEKEKFEAKMSEEQRKLQKDRNVFDKYCKQVRNQPTKKEREEIANLKKEMEKLSEALATKESRWGASQARLRNHIKFLEKENRELKSEVEKLKKQNSKKVTFDGGKSINTKIINAINSELGKLKPHLVKTGNARPKYQSLSTRVESNPQKKPMRRIKSVPDLKKSSEKGILNDSEENFLASPSSVSEGDRRKCSQKKSELRGWNRDSQLTMWDQLTDSRSVARSDAAQDGLSQNRETKDRNSHLCDSQGSIATEDNRKGTKCVDRDLVEVLQDTFFDNKDRGDYNGTSGTISEIKRRLENLNLLHHSEPFNGEGDKNKEIPQLGNHKISDRNSGECSSGSEEEEEEEDDDEEDQEENQVVGPDPCCEAKCDRDTYLRKSGSPTYLSYHCQTMHECNSVREKNFEDGRREIYYPNGNIKKISADSRIIKMIYYNGDLKETDVSEGSEKYYYAETKTWHTTYKGGLEVLEFPNGQTERRHPDGSTEILFPNGCVRYCDSSGKDEWRFLDGTVIKTDKNGDKVLLLPNGQKEVHTKEYKKREYPDGTVKLLYADGTQETRYATGRVRLKDKDGNLVMDSGGIR